MSVPRRSPRIPLSPRLPPHLQPSENESTSEVSWVRAVRMEMNKLLQLHQEQLARHLEMWLSRLSEAGHDGNGVLHTLCSDHVHTEDEPFIPKSISTASVAGSPMRSAACSTSESHETHREQIGLIAKGEETHGNGKRYATIPGQIAPIVTEEKDSPSLGMIWNEVPSTHTDKGGPRNLDKKNLESSIKRILSTNRLKGKKRADDFLTQNAKAKAEAEESALEMFVTSMRYEWASVVVIMSNAVFVGLQTQLLNEEMLKGRGRESEENGWWMAGGVVFTLVFLVDVLLRWYVDGLVYFFINKDWAWNVFDSFIVVFSVLETFLDLAGLKSSSMGSVSVLRVIRVVRVVKVLRVIRVVRFFRELKMMLFSLMQSFRALLWALVLLALIFYIFGVAFTLGTFEYCVHDDRWRAQDTSNLREWFGTIDRSIMSLFMTVSGGRDWNEYYETLYDLHFLYRMFYIFFIWFYIIAAMNVVTGVFVENAIGNSDSDKDFLIQEQMEQKRQNEKRMRRLFEEMDDNNTGDVQLSEFERHFDDERAIAYFNALDLDYNEAKTLFTLLDTDRSGSVDIDEFMLGCDRLKGDAKSIDMAMLHCEVRWLSAAMLDLLESCGVMSTENVAQRLSPQLSPPKNIGVR